MTKKMTRWFAPHEKPERVGVYEVKFFIAAGYAHWDGKLWANQVDTVHVAYLNSLEDERFAIQRKSWRGFTKEQK